MQSIIEQKISTDHILYWIFFLTQINKQFIKVQKVHRKWYPRLFFFMHERPIRWGPNWLEGWSRANTSLPLGVRMQHQNAQKFNLQNVNRIELRHSRWLWEKVAVWNQNLPFSQTKSQTDCCLFSTYIFCPFQWVDNFSGTCLWSSIQTNVQVVSLSCSARTKSKILTSMHNADILWVTPMGTGGVTLLAKSSFVRFVFFFLIITLYLREPSTCFRLLFWKRLGKFFKSLCIIIVVLIVFSYRYLLSK